MAERDGLNVGTTIMFSAPLVEWAVWFMQRTLPLMIRSWEFAISKKSNMVDKKKNFFMVKVLMVSNALHFKNGGNALIMHHHGVGLLKMLSNLIDPQVAEQNQFP